MLESFLQHPLYAEMSEADRLHEVPFSGQAGDTTSEGRIDALYSDKSGNWTLVEFKTTRIEDRESLVLHLNSEQHRQARSQARRYAEAVEKLLGRRPKAFVCLLSRAQEPVVEEVWPR